MSPVGRALPRDPLPRSLALIALTALLTGTFEALHLSAALLIGAMAAAIILSALDAGVRVPGALFVAAQALLGCMIARVMAPSILHEMGRQWPVFLAALVSVIVAACALGLLLERLRVLPRTVAIWGSFPGAATAMVLMAEAYGADIRLVAFMQYLRVVVVALVASGVARVWSSAPAAAAAHASLFGPVAWAAFAATLAVALVGAGLGRVLRIPAGPLIGPMLLGAVLQDVGGLHIELPPLLLALAYSLIGWNIGVRFSRDILRHVAQALPRVLASILALVAACALFAVALMVFAGIDPLTAYLATSPGGADSVAIIAASSSKVDMPFVMALQISRSLVILFAGPSLARLLAARFGTTDEAPAFQGAPEASARKTGA